MLLDVVERIALLAPAGVELLEDLRKLFLLNVLLLELLVDRPQRFAMNPAALGDRAKRLGKMGKIRDQLVLPLGLAVEAVADRAHQIGQGVESILKVLDGGAVLVPRAEKRAARLDKGRVAAQRQLAVAIAAPKETAQSCQECLLLLWLLVLWLLAHLNASVRSSEVGRT